MKYLLLSLLLCVNSHAQIILKGGTLAGGSLGSVAAGGGGGCVNAYRTNDTATGGTQTGIGTGDRTSGASPVIIATIDGVSKPQLCNNNFNTGEFFFNGAATAGQTVRVQLSSTAVATEFMWFQQTTATHGVWQVQGSNDGSAWTSIGSTFTLGGGVTFVGGSGGFVETITTASANTTTYLYYQFLGISGTTDADPWLYELWIQNCQ